MDLRALIRKHSQAGPRYTSYPTAPQWKESVGRAEYESHLAKQKGSGRDLALYFHIPFCESLCYYCGCNIKITRDHGRSDPYIDAMIAEMKAVSGHLGEKRRVSQISWGGGTPTFLDLLQIRRLHEATLQYFTLTSDAEVSIEVDPRVTSFEQLGLLRSLGFNRISLGVQDFNLETQNAINRVQSIEMTEAMLKESRRLGFHGVNFDLMYGLPHQTLKTFEVTLKEIARIHPDRIAFYNYAHLPQMIPHQKILDPLPMPNSEERVEIFNFALETLNRAGYEIIGMDHFAVKDDELYLAIEKGNLYRNFMGYTVKRGTDMLGFGASAIGEIDNAFFQNIREAKAYETAISELGTATFRGTLLTPDDVMRKYIIQSLMCRFELNFAEFEKRFSVPFLPLFEAEMLQLPDFEKDGSLTLSPTGIQITPQGRIFLRNIAMVFDAYLKAKGTFKNYSKTV